MVVSDAVTWTKSGNALFMWRHHLNLDQMWIFHKSSLLNLSLSYLILLLVLRLLMHHPPLLLLPLWVLPHHHKLLSRNRTRLVTGTPRTISDLLSDCFAISILRGKECSRLDLLFTTSCNHCNHACTELIKDSNHFTHYQLFSKVSA